MKNGWRHGTGTVSPGSGGRQVLLTFHPQSGKPLQHRGWATPDCQFIDMDDGGLYIRGQHPFDMAPHEWLRVATAWVMRAAMITFKDGSRHITPGVPKPVAKPKPNDGYYVGQWMRDGFYGISNGWGLVSRHDIAGIKLHSSADASDTLTCIVADRSTRACTRPSSRTRSSRWAT